MGVGKIEFKSDSIEYSTPVKIVTPLIAEFNLTQDVCASASNHKCENYWTITDNALTLDWIGNCWMNPPFSKDLNKWVRKACNDAEKFGGTKVCERSNWQLSINHLLTATSPLFATMAVLILELLTEKLWLVIIIGTPILI